MPISLLNCGFPLYLLGFIWLWLLLAFSSYWLSKLFFISFWLSIMPWRFWIIPDRLLSFIYYWGFSSIFFSSSSMEDPFSSSSSASSYAGMLSPECKSIIFEPLQKATMISEATLSSWIRSLEFGRLAPRSTFFVFFRGSWSLITCLGGGRIGIEEFMISRLML